MEFLRGSRKAYLHVVGETDLTNLTPQYSAKHMLSVQTVRRVPVFTVEVHCAFGI